MRFRARIYVQGVGIYRLSKDRRQLDVLFPDSQQRHLAEDAKLTNAEGKTFPEHHAVVQFSARNLRPAAADKWLTVDLANYRLRVDTDSPIALAFPNRAPDLPGVPRLADCLAAAGLSDVQLIDDERAKEATLARLEITRGIVGPDSEYVGSWEWSGHNGVESLKKASDYTSVVRVELGAVTRLKLVFERLEGRSVEPKERQIELGPAAGYCDVWVRHDCRKFLSLRPQPGDAEIRAGDKDLDFFLNFSLVDDLARVREATLAGRLPLPMVNSSWKAGSPIGGDPHKCMPGGG